MVRMIPRKHPWAVTGTPIIKNEFTDIAGLLEFIDVPAQRFDARFWKHVTSPDHQLIFLRYLSIYMHRTTKRAVSHELGNTSL